MLSAFRGQRGPDRERGEAERGRQVWRRVRGRGRGSRPGDDFAAYLQGRSSPAQEEPGTEAEGGRWPQEYPLAPHRTPRPTRRVGLRKSLQHRGRIPSTQGLRGQGARSLTQSPSLPGVFSGWFYFPFLALRPAPRQSLPGLESDAVRAVALSRASRCRAELVVRVDSQLQTIRQLISRSPPHTPRQLFLPFLRPYFRFQDFLFPCLDKIAVHDLLRQK